MSRRYLVDRGLVLGTATHEPHAARWEAPPQAAPTVIIGKVGLLPPPPPKPPPRIMVEAPKPYRLRQMARDAKRKEALARKRSGKGVGSHVGPVLHSKPPGHGKPGSQGRIATRARPEAPWTASRHRP